VRRLTKLQEADGDFKAKVRNNLCSKMQIKAEIDIKENS